MAMRLTGLMSGMDTETIISQLVTSRKTKVDDAKKAQKKLEWKQEAWKTLNTKARKLFDGALGNMRFESSFMKKTTKVSNSNVVSVITGEGAMNSVQSLQVEKLAKSAYLTGGQLSQYSGGTKLSELGIDEEAAFTVKGKVINIDGETTINDFVSELNAAGIASAAFDASTQSIQISETDLQSLDLKPYGNEELLSKLGLAQDSTDAWSIGKLPGRTAYAADTKLSQLGVDGDTSFRITVNGETKEINVNGATTISELVNQMQDAGVRASFDATNQRFYIAAKDTGKENDFRIEAVSGNSESEDLLRRLGLSAAGGALKDEAQDAVIRLNGVEYTSSRNSIEVNGLTLNISATTAEGETVTITTEDDTDGIYDMVKNFFKEYNELINEMDKLYNADSARGYEPLTSEEKEAMTEDEIEEWEKKVKDALLRRDGTLGTLASAMKEVMVAGVEVNGKKMYLSNFGIETLSYFTAADNEKNAYHIDGDSDDANTAGNADKLKSLIASDPDTVVSFFTGLSKNLYGKMQELMAGTDYSSAYTIYEDKKMKEEYDDYTSKIKDLEKKLTDYEDQWYAKFAAMESAMAKMQKNASAVTSLLGGGM